jgi:23S rRNA (guanosine2251-2'-O)-methyltransferase
VAAGGRRELLFGVHPVAEALRAGRRSLHRLHVRRGAGASELRAELADLARCAAAAGVPVEDLPAPEFDRRAPPGVVHQGLLLEVGPLPLVGLLEISAGEGWLIALDGVEDPQNLGAIARVADAAGARGLVLTEHRAAPLSPAASRASAGALEHLPVARVTNLTRSLNLLKEKGFWIHGADPAAALELFAAAERVFDPRLVLVLGAERRGLRPGIRAALDVVYRVPMTGRVGSLNVATAAAVILFEWRRRAAARAAPGKVGP